MLRLINKASGSLALSYIPVWLYHSKPQ